MSRRNVHVAGENIKLCFADKQIEIDQHFLSCLWPHHSRRLEIELLDHFLIGRHTDGIFLSALNKYYRAQRIGFVESYAAATVKGVRGVRFTSKKTGNSIFLPGNGYINGRVLERAVAKAMEEAMDDISVSER